MFHQIITLSFDEASTTKKIKTADYEKNVNLLPFGSYYRNQY